MCVRVYVCVFAGVCLCVCTQALSGGCTHHVLHTKMEQQCCQHDIVHVCTYMERESTILGHMTDLTPQEFSTSMHAHARPCTQVLSIQPVL